ncbi:MAG: response regulator [Moraxellaceae bacterium]|nr:response regulator [Pseudobdellovibrionaceae bacterium]
MPLRILLADESTTIKKAFQLALSDLGAEIKSVPSGLDVMTVALDFRPQLIFADVLLTKKSGYEVCQEITASIETKHIPVILMWSNFMEFNSGLATQGGYADKLEKPFDSAALRKLVTKFYKETESHPLNGLLDFPTIPEFAEDASLDDQYEHVQLQDFAAPASNNRSKIHIETESHGDFEEVVLVQSSAERSQDQYKISSQIKSYLDSSPAALNKIEKHVNDEVSQQLSRQSNHRMSQPGSNRVDENLVREEVRALTEKICFQIIPDIAEKIIRSEIEKLFKNIEKSI